MILSGELLYHCVQFFLVSQPSTILRGLILLKIFIIRISELFVGSTSYFDAITVMLKG